ncbi:MAG: nucleotidyltransferase family protein [Blastocatellales bacterium]
MSPTDKLLLSALLPTEASRERARQLIAENASEIDWAAFTRRANFHHTAALSRFNLALAGLSDCPPAQFRSELDEISRAWAARHLAYVSETARLVAALSDAGIVALPLKGAALMLGGYYPQAGLRAALDIDLLVDPERAPLAEQVARDCGYAEIPGRRDVRPRQRLENERNHSWPRRGPSGLILELHHRAFHFAKGARDFGFDELLARARRRRPDDASSPLLPSPADLALHLIHHTIVDLQSAHAILRTLADLHFIFAREPQSREEMKEQARQLGFAGATQSAVRLLRLLEEGTMIQLDEAAPDGEIELLLETALMESPGMVAEAARLFEYLDFSRRPIKKLGALFSLLFTSRAHLENLYGEPKRGSVYLNYLRRPFDLMKRFNWRSLSPATMRRVWKLRRMSLNKTD